jgi:hypothetical protein
MRLPLLIAGLVTLAVVPALADEGMWTFDNFPSAAVRTQYGVNIDQAWLDRVRQSAVRLSTGCSASVVSGQGLVLTNHHCVAGCAQDLSTAERNYVDTGYLTAARGEERQCPGMQAEILTTIGDVTPRVNAATAGKNGQEFTRARDAAVAAIEKDSCAGREATHRCQVISLYQGGQYKLYTFRKYADVRLVFAPESDMAFFGGDPDNFNFPRYDLDASFVRLYENGRPVATPAHLRWSTAPPRDGEPVFVVGNPGATNRLWTEAQLATQRDLVLMDTITQYSELRGRLIRFGEENAEHERTARGDLFGVENNLKRWRGMLQALHDPALFDMKRKADADLKAKTAANPQLAREIGDPWKEIADAQKERAGMNTAYTMLEGRPGFGSSLYAYARRLVRGAEERAKPNGERLPEYADARLPLLEKTLLDPEPVEPDLEQLKLEFWLSKLREYLTADAAETKLYLGKDSPEGLSRALIASKLGDPATRRQLWEGGLAAVRASNDPMIRFVLKTDPTARAVRKRFEERVDGPTDRAAERIAKARFAIYGTRVYPDATFSLRISYGAVAGWSEPGRTIPPFTNFKGLYERATGQDPFKLAPRWVGAEAKLNPDTVLDFSTTNDIVGGNSGSPVVNARGEVLGAAFDGNIHSLGGAYYFDPALNRTVVVSTAAVTEALAKIYGQTALVAELTAQ